MFFLKKLEPKSNDKKLVYFIACHKNVNQVLRLVKVIYHQDNLYFINIDKKVSTIFYKEIILRELGKCKNVYFLRKRVGWGRWSQVQVVLDVIKKALSIDSSWTHFINLSGQDFPLKNQKEIQVYLSGLKDKIFLEAKHYLPDTKVAEDRFSSIIRISRFFKVVKRLDLLNPEIKFYKGSQWMILSRAFCEYTNNSCLSKKLKPWFKRFNIPDESFFPTLAANSQFSSDIIWDNKRFIKWTFGAAHPEILDLKYWEALSSSSAFFARKFDENIDTKIISALEDLLEK